VNIAIRTTLILIAFSSLLSFALVSGCSDDDTKKKVLPADSPTRSVEAAEAFNEGNKLRKTDKSGAIAAYTRALQADPVFEFAYYNRGLTLTELYRFKEAREDLNSLKGLSSERATTLESLIKVAEELATAQYDPATQPAK
jgi:tetratricopeptide (TPR) repeat protein